MFRFSPIIVLAVAGLGLVACDGNDPAGPGEPVQVVEPGPPTTDSLSLALTRLPKSFYVNPKTGKDTNAGTKLLPFKTLARALGSAIAKDTVRLAPGTYSATTGERFTNASQQVQVPAGVLILGTPAGELTTRLQGVAGETGLNFKGAAIVRNVVVAGFSTGIRATQGVQLLRQIILDQNFFGMDLSGSAQLKLVASNVHLVPAANGLVTGVLVKQQAQFTMDGGIMSADGPNCSTGVKGVELNDASRATFKNAAAFTQIAGSAIKMTGTSKALLTGLTTIDRDFTGAPGNVPSGACSPNASVITFNSASLTVSRARLYSTKGSFAVGIASYSDSPLRVADAILAGHSGAALRINKNVDVVVSGALFSGNQVAIDGRALEPGNLTITGSNLTQNTTGIEAPFFKLRNSRITLNQVGIVVTSQFTDLGLVGDPGNNVISGNTLTGVRFDPPIINAGVGGIFAAGNTWTASTQGSDGSGHYPLNPLLNNSSPIGTGKNFALPVNIGFFQIQL